MAALSLAVALLVLGAALALIVGFADRINIAIPAVVGAIAMVGLGFVPLSQVVDLWRLTWDATVTLVGLLLVAHLLDEAGFFAWLSLHAIRSARGHGPAAWGGLMAMTVLVTLFLANDGAVLIMTPIVAEFVLALGWEATGPAALAFLLPVGFLVDATSTLLPPSNLTNIITADAFGIRFLSYVRQLGPAWGAQLAVSFLVLWLLFGRRVPPRISTEGLPSPASALRHPRVARTGGWVLAGLVVAYVANSWLRWPTAVWVGAAALVLAAMALGSGAISSKRLLRLPPWHVVLFAQGMFVMVAGIGNLGLTGLLAAFWSNRSAALPFVLRVGGLESLLSAATNNLPALLIGVLALARAAAHRPALAIGALLIGSDVGSKLTPIGSLATLMWLHALSRKGFRIGWRRYLGFAPLVTVPVVLVALAVLAWGS